PEWQKPLWAALDRRGIDYAALDLKRAAFDPDAVPGAPLYFNQASPSAYVRGNTRAVPLALSLMRSLELAGARVLNGSRAFLREQPSLWLPDNLLLLQEYFPVDAARGIVRMEFLGGKLLYAMRVVSHGAFNLCPSEACNPEGGDGHCAVPEQLPARPVEFFP